MYPEKQLHQNQRLKPLATGLQLDPTADLLWIRQASTRTRHPTGPRTPASACCSPTGFDSHQLQFFSKQKPDDPRLTRRRRPASTGGGGSQTAVPKSGGPVLTSLRSLPQPRNLGRLLHLRFGLPEAAGVRIRPLPRRSYSSLGRICFSAVFLRLGDMEPPSPSQRHWHGLLYRRSRAWRRWPAARQVGVASVPRSCLHATRPWPRWSAPA